MFKIVSESHVDHALTQDHLDFILAKFANKSAFFIENVELPKHLASIPCALRGPLVGDEKIPDSECQMVVRGDRKYPSRVCDLPPKMVRTLTVIGGGLGGEPCVLYTAYGGPVAPREPGDETLSAENKVTSEAFWAKHALSSKA